MTLIGHSLGGVLAVGMTALARDLGPPTPVALVPVQPGGCLGCSEARTNLGVALQDLTGVPFETRLLMVVAEDDEVEGDAAATARWNRIRSIPPTRGDFVVLRIDDHGVVPLRPDHLLAQTMRIRGTLVALDWYGTWKLFDLLLAGAYAGEGCEQADGGTAPLREMGFWNDGTPVVELLSDSVPPELGPPWGNRPIIHSWLATSQGSRAQAAA